MSYGHLYIDAVQQLRGDQRVLNALIICSIIYVVMVVLIADIILCGKCLICTQLHDVNREYVSDHLMVLNSQNLYIESSKSASRCVIYYQRSFQIIYRSRSCTKPWVASAACTIQRC